MQEKISIIIDPAAGEITIDGTRYALTPIGSKETASRDTHTSTEQDLIVYSHNIGNLRYGHSSDRYAMCPEDAKEVINAINSEASSAHFYALQEVPEFYSTDPIPTSDVLKAIGGKFNTIVPFSEVPYKDYNSLCRMNDTFKFGVIEHGGEQVAIAVVHLASAYFQGTYKKGTDNQITYDDTPSPYADKPRGFQAHYITRHTLQIKEIIEAVSSYPKAIVIGDFNESAEPAEVVSEGKKWQCGLMMDRTNPFDLSTVKGFSSSGFVCANDGSLITADPCSTGVESPDNVLVRGFRGIKSVSIVENTIANKTFSDHKGLKVTISIQ